MVCSNLLDWRCIFVNELIGSPLLAVVIFAILFFIVAAKMKFGFDTTLVVAVPIILIFALTTAGMGAIMAFVTLLAGFMLAWIWRVIVEK